MKISSNELMLLLNNRLLEIREEKAVDQKDIEQLSSDERRAVGIFWDAKETEVLYMLDLLQRLNIHAAQS